MASFADLIENRRVCPVKFASGATIRCEYEPDQLSPAFFDRLGERIEAAADAEANGEDADETAPGTSLSELLCEVLVGWDLEGPYPKRNPVVAAGEPVPLTPEMLRSFPTPYARHILNTITEDAVPDPQKRRASKGR